MRRLLKLLWLAVYALAVPAVQGLLLPRRTADPTRSTDHAAVHFVLMHAYGMGGAVRAVVNVAEHLGDRMHVEIVSVIRRNDQPAFPLPANAVVEVLDDRRPGARRSVLQRSLSALPSVLVHPHDGAWGDFSLWTDLQLLRWLRRTRTGVVVTTRPGLALLAASFARQRTPVVAQEHIGFKTYSRPLRREIRRQYDKLDVLTPLTEQDLRAFESHLQTSTPRVVRVPNAVTPLPERPQTVREPVIVGAGRLQPRKGFDLLIRAFGPVAAKHPEWRLHIYGEGAERPALEALVASSGLTGRVLLPGAHASIGEPFASAAMFALSSRGEGFPMVLLEAMSKGAAVVAFDCDTGPAEILTHGQDGLLVPPEDVAGLSAALLQLVEDDGARERLGREAMRTSETYSLASVGGTWEALLTTVLRPGG